MSNETIHIVYLDDEEDLLNLFQAMIELPENYKISTFSDREKAADFLKANTVTGLFVDWRMPGGDGLSFITENKHTLENTHIFLITGDLDLPQIAKDSFKVIFSKPVDYVELTQLIMLLDNHSGT